jgi:hypothetical protein
VGADGAVLQLVTRCNSAEEFIERFARFTTATDVIVPALPHVSVGTDSQFVICLKDRSVVMRGRCEVTEIRPVAVAPGAAPPPSVRALMRLRLREMDAHSCGIHLRLMERHASSPRPSALPAPAPAPAAAASVPPMQSASQAVPVVMLGVDESAVTVVGDSRRAWDSEATEISPQPPPETRAPGAPFTLPANPLSDLDAADLASFVELTLLESNGATDVAPLGDSAMVDGDAQADQDPGPGAPPARAARRETRLDRARRITGRVALYTACLVVGLLFGTALRSGSEAAPVVSAPNLAPPPEIEPPSTALARAEEAERLVPPPANVDVTSSRARAAIKPNKRRVSSSSRTAR